MRSNDLNHEKVDLNGFKRGVFGWQKNLFKHAK